MTLTANAFADFFEEVHGHRPFPWQDRLLKHLAEAQRWPDTLDLPTGAGKTAAIDIAVFHLALEAYRGQERRAPVRIAFVVDRRLVVDDAFERARKIAAALARPKGHVVELVAEELRRLSGEGPPLIARRLRGGMPREDDWARTPAQPTVLCSTVDQVGSRLFFRGYGVSDSMKPVHAGLIGSDCLILLDEAHLAEPFRQSLEWVRVYRGHGWCEVDHAAPSGVALLTATPGAQSSSRFSLSEDDRKDPVLASRLQASKPVRLVTMPKAKTPARDTAVEETEDSGAEQDDKDLGLRATALVGEVRRAFDHFKKEEHGVPAPAIGVVVNRVARARKVFALLRKELEGCPGEVILMIGPARALDRAELVDMLAPIRPRIWQAGERRLLEQPLVVVATQCLEAGVDIDLDGLITEAAPVDALRQRFGRLNRAGRSICPYGAIIAAGADISARNEDPVYGRAIRHAWEYLTEKPDARAGGVLLVDFGLHAFDERVREFPVPSEAVSEKHDAPVLLPAHLDLLSQTSPIPAADPDVALYLHGPYRKPDSVSVVWRADIDPTRPEETRRLLILVPPRSTEAMELPVWVVRRWLIGNVSRVDRLADLPESEPDDEDRAHADRAGQQVFRWKGDREESRWITPAELRPGDSIVVPASFGGVDAFGWDPRNKSAVTDRGRLAAEPFAGRRFVVRVAPELVGESVRPEELADALAAAASQRWRDLRSALLELRLPELLLNDLLALDDARRGAVVTYESLYGYDEQERPRGIVFVAPFGIRSKGQDEDGRPNSTEDDWAGSMPGFQLTLVKHSEDVARCIEDFARASGLTPERVADLKLSGLLHDLGKADPRFQAWLHYGDPFGLDGDEPQTILAKSGRFLPRVARTASGLPEKWRHEALSARRAMADERLASANDPDLVLWLIGTHHGYGRPFFPHRDPVEHVPDVGPQSLAFSWRGLDWASLFERLKARYGLWELARMEAIVRLADHRASEAAALEESVA